MDKKEVKLMKDSIITLPYNVQMYDKESSIEPIYKSAVDAK